MDTQDRSKAHRAWRSAERVKRLSDRLVGIGPFGLGLDGLLAWIPGVNVTYTVGAAALLMYEARAAKASLATMLRMGIYLLADTATSGVPIAGWAVDTLFPGHGLAARALQKDIEARHGPSELSKSPWRTTSGGRRTAAH